MAIKLSQIEAVSVSLHLLLFISSSLSATFTLTNNCAYTVWPGILSGAGTAPLSTTGFVLPTGASQSLNVPAGWSGRLWARTRCFTDSSGRFTCLTGDCGSNAVQCSGGAAPPATLAEFTLNGANDLDFYDVSLVDGYNLPMLVVPSGGQSGNCSSTGCLVDLNGICPSDLKVVESNGEGVACKSACEAFGSPEYCCSGQYQNPNTCKPSSYSQLFKNACPRAYSYAFDDATSTFTCSSADYAITFCPSTTSQRAQTRHNNPQAATPLVNDTMVIFGASDVYGSGSKLTLSTGKFGIFAVMLTWTVFILGPTNMG